MSGFGLQSLNPSNLSRQKLLYTHTCRMHRVNGEIQFGGYVDTGAIFESSATKRHPCAGTDSLLHQRHRLSHDVHFPKPLIFCFESFNVIRG